MKTNLNTIQSAIDFIEDNLENVLDLESISNEMNYSKYHLSRMFTNITGLSIHQYILRRRLSEAARSLVYTNHGILNIALSIGYKTQQSFNVSFKTCYKCTPQTFRKKQNFYPLQLKFIVHKKENLKKMSTMKICLEEKKDMLLVGFHENTRIGFLAIAKCWHALHRKKQCILNRVDKHFLIGFNDYHNWENMNTKQPVFDYFAAAEVERIEKLRKGMESISLPASKYLVFKFLGKSKDSIEDIVNYIYQEWFPQSSCVLNEKAQYDFVKYGEQENTEGNSHIEFWIPIL